MKNKRKIAAIVMSMTLASGMLASNIAPVVANASSTDSVSSATTKTGSTGSNQSTPPTRPSDNNGGTPPEKPSGDNGGTPPDMQSNSSNSTNNNSSSSSSGSGQTTGGKKSASSGNASGGQKPSRFVTSRSLAPNLGGDGSRRTRSASTASGGTPGPIARRTGRSRISCSRGCWRPATRSPAESRQTPMPTGTNS